MKVVELKHQCQLLAGSAGANKLSNNEGFSWDGDGFDDGDVDY